MKYTIPYDDKIILPHIKEIKSIGISADSLAYDRKELSGEVIITGDYTLDNSSDLMEFKHNIPVSLLIDEAKLEPEINISNFKYEVIPGRGVEVIFDLDVILIEDVQEEEENIIEEEEVVVDEEICEEITRDDNEVEETVEEEELEDIKTFQEQIDKNLDEVLNSGNREEIEEVVEEKLEEIVDEIEDSFSTKLEATLSTFDTSFVPRDNDKYTTYKILLIEENETIDQVLEARNLSRALICKEYQFDNEKIVLKLEDD